MSKGLVTGASGFVGRAIWKRLARSHDVTGVSYRQSLDGCVQADIRDPSEFSKLLDRAAPSFVVHAAAYPDPDFCEENIEESRRLNVSTVETLRRVLPPATRLVFISTDYVFDGSRPPYREEDERRPGCVYGRQKVEAEDVLRGRARTTILRIPLQVGEGVSQTRRGFIKELQELIELGHEVEVDDVLMRFPTWTLDTAEVVAFLLDREADGVFHFSGPQGGTRYHWALETAKAMGQSAGHIRPGRRVMPRPARRPLNSELHTGKIRAMGFDRFTPMEAIIRSENRSTP